MLCDYNKLITSDLWVLSFHVTVVGIFKTKINILWNLFKSRLIFFCFLTVFGTHKVNSLVFNKIQPCQMKRNWSKICTFMKSFNSFCCHIRKDNVRLWTASPLSPQYPFLSCAFRILGPCMKSALKWNCVSETSLFNPRSTKRFLCFISDSLNELWFTNFSATLYNFYIVRATDILHGMYLIQAITSNRATGRYLCVKQSLILRNTTS
jgi:hypothetical protein